MHDCGDIRNTVQDLDTTVLVITAPILSDSLLGQPEYVDVIFC